MKRKIEKKEIEYGTPEHYEKSQELIAKTAVANKTAAYLIELTERSKDFQASIKRFRKNWNIPENGYSQDADLKDRDFNKVPGEQKFLGNLFYLADEYGLDVGWAYWIKQYILYNDIIYAEDITPVDIFDLYSMLKYDKDGGVTQSEHNEIWIDFLEMMARSHPVALLVDPYITERDLVDYIKKLYKHEIKPIQDEYKKPKSLRGRIRIRNEKIKQRDKFIYENKHLPKSQLASLVYRNFHQLLDHPYLNKIIAKMKQENK